MENCDDPGAVCAAFVWLRDGPLHPPDALPSGGYEVIIPVARLAEAVRQGDAGDDTALKQIEAEIVKALSGPTGRGVNLDVEELVAALAKDMRDLERRITGVPDPFLGDDIGALESPFPKRFR